MGLPVAHLTIEAEIMMNDQTLTILHEMKLNGMTEAYQEQAINPEFKKMNFEDRFS